MRKVTNRCVCSMIRGSGCSKSRLAKAAGAEVAVSAAKWKMARHCGAKRICKSKCTKHLSLGAIFEVAMSKNGKPLWREAHLLVKTSQLPSNFWTSDVEKLHAAVAQSALSSQNHKKQGVSGYFLSFRCLKMARSCGAKHICKSKC